MPLMVSKNKPALKKYFNKKAMIKLAKQEIKEWTKFLKKLESK